MEVEIGDKKLDWRKQTICDRVVMWVLLCYHSDPRWLVMVTLTQPTVPIQPRLLNQEQSWSICIRKLFAQHGCFSSSSLGLSMAQSFTRARSCNVRVQEKRIFSYTPSVSEEIVRGPAKCHQKHVEPLPGFLSLHLLSRCRYEWICAVWFFIEWLNILPPLLQCSSSRCVSVVARVLVELSTHSSLSKCVWDAGIHAKLISPWLRQGG